MSARVESFLFIVWAAIVAADDLRHRRVANAWSLMGLAAASLCALTARGPFGIAPIQAAQGALMGFGVLLPFFVLRLMGAADVKVFAVLGAWCGVHALLDLWISASIMGGLHAFALLLGTRTRFISLGLRGEATVELRGHRATPYAACLVTSALGMLVLRQLT
ncbi:A24 family peptidase [Paraburkholderia sediminicola]|uniref:A24 family peptidase n=1 Tax=Paraburkholderia sediminicola TaxID=458836 RepID=UPI0038B957C2